MVKLIGLCLIAAFSLNISSHSWGATRSKPVAVSKPRPILNGAYRDRALRALRQPLKERLVMVKSLGNKGLIALQNLAFDPQESLQTRWRATTSMGQVWPKESLKTLEKALVSNEWFMRNAAMIALTHGSRHKAVEWADKLLDDKALVVRTAAVQAIDRVRAKELSDKMWDRLNAKENFRHKKSLWIRKHIARALSKFARPSDAPRFISLLRDKDKKLHPYAIKGLERSTGQILGSRKTTTYWKKEKWLAWWRDKKGTSVN